MRLLLILAAMNLAASAQTLPPAAAAGLPAVPTTRVLAIGHLTGGTTREKVMTVLPQEARETVRLYLAGKLDQWFSRRDQNGVVFVLNVSTVAEARALLEDLPLGKAKLMSFDLIPLGPLAPLGLLLPEPAGPPK